MIQNFNIGVFIGSLMNSFILLFMIKSMINIIKPKLIYSTISLIILGIYIFISYTLTNNVLRIIGLYFMVVLCSKICFGFEKGNLYKILIYSFLELIAMIISELIVSIILIILGNSLTISTIENIYGNFLINIFIMFFSVLIVYIFVLVNSHKNKNISFEELPIKQVVLYIFASVIIFCLMYYVSFWSENRNLVFIVNLSSIIIFTIIIFKTFEINNKNAKIRNEYDMLLTNLSEYENLLDIQRVSNHENKNQLLVIKGMITKKENNVTEYIDSIIDTQYADNEVLIMKTNRIPSGGLRGLIYYKMLMMKDKKIDVTLDVDRNLKELNFSEIPIKTNQELCKIVGVFLDNSIQAVENINNKIIEIFISYLNDELIIKISNSYEGNIDLDKIDNKGYTTKGKGHGYGLSLVKHIIYGNSKFVNEREINKRLFSQIIKLKI